MCQIDEPVKPTTVRTPSFAAARAVSFISLAARWRTPSGLPSPQIRGGQDALMAFVDRMVADRLPDQVVGDGVDRQVVLGEHLPLLVHIGVIGERPVDLEVVAPARDLQTVVAPLGREATHLLERQVSPLAGEQSDRSCHHRFLPVNASRLDAADLTWDVYRPDLGPGAGLRTALHRVQHLLDPQRVVEGRVRIAVVGDRLDEVPHLVGEAVLVADDVSRAATTPTCTDEPPR